MALRSIWLAAGVFTAAVIALLVRWLVPGPVGAADNGDGWRLLCQVGGGDPDRLSEDWVQLTYPPAPFCFSGYVSSQLWFLRLAGYIGARLGSTDVVDLRVLGVLTCVLLAGAVTLLAVALPLSVRGRLAAAALVLLVVADSAVFGFFVSVLSEGAAFFGILVTAAGLVLLQRPDRWRLVGAVTTCGGALVAVNAKTQTLPLLAALAICLVLTQKPQKIAWARWALPLAVLAVTTTGTMVVQQAAEVGDEWKQINAYNVIFVKIVREEQAVADLAELDLPAPFARYQGVDWYEPEAARTDPLWPEYTDRVTRRAVARYYLEHPARTVEILHSGAKDLLTARPENIGSYPEASGERAMAREFRVPVLSGLTRLVAPLGLFALVPLWLLTAVGGAVSWRRAQPVAVVVLFLLVAGTSQFGIAALGEGIEGVKHQLIALFCTMLGAVMAGIALMARRQPRAAELLPRMTDPRPATLSTQRSRSEAVPTTGHHQEGTDLATPSSSTES
jgi:hypothetical protein